MLYLLSSFLIDALIMSAFSSTAIIAILKIAYFACDYIAS